MRLLLLTPSFPPDVAGSATWSYELAQRFAPVCDEFALVTLAGAGPAALEHSSAFEVIRLDASGLAFSARGAVQLARLCARRRFDTVLGADWALSGAALVCRGRGSTPRIYTALRGRAASSGNAQSAARPLQALLHARLRASVLQRVDGVFPSSPALYHWLSNTGVRLDHVSVVPSGCNTEHFRPGPRPALGRELGLTDRRVLLSVSQLSAGSGIDRVLYALSALGVRFPDLRYVIAGDGPEREQLELLAERLRISHKVRFLGPVDPLLLPQLYQLCDLFVHAPSDALADRAGPSLALLEAGACGKAVVSTLPIEGADQVVDGDNGMLVPAGDSQALVGVLEVLLERPELARQLGERGRQRAEEHASWEDVMSRLLAVMSDRSKGAPCPSASAPRLAWPWSDDDPSDEPGVAATVAE